MCYSNTVTKSVDVYSRNTARLEKPLSRWLTVFKSGCKLLLAIHCVEYKLIWAKRVSKRIMCDEPASFVAVVLHRLALNSIQSIASWWFFIQFALITTFSSGFAIVNLAVHNVNFASKLADPTRSLRKKVIYFQECCEIKFIRMIARRRSFSLLLSLPFSRCETSEEREGS